MITAAREQQGIDLALGLLGDVIPTGTGCVGGFQHRRDAFAGYALRCRDGPAGQALGAELQYELRPDLSYH